MAIVTLDDASGQIDVLCFSDIYHTHRELLMKDKLIIVEGEVSMDDFTNNYRVVGREIFSIEQARERYAKHLQIRFGSDQLENIKKLASILEKFKGGKCRVILDYIREDAKANLQLGEAWCVRPVDALMNSLRDTFSDNNIDIEY
jgi:DNA polymerase-3 subunit alpha